MNKYIFEVELEILTHDRQTFIIEAKDRHEAGKQLDTAIHNQFDDVDDWEITEETEEEIAEPPFIDPNQMDIDDFLNQGVS